MEERQNNLTEEQYIAQLMAQHEALAKQVGQEAATAVSMQIPAPAPQPGTLPAPTPAPKRAVRARKRSPYRYGALIVAGVFCYALLTALAALVWGSILFSRQGDVGESAAMPLAIFLGAVFLSCFVVTLLSRGGTIFPALGVALIVNILPFLLPEAPLPQLNAIAAKLGCTLAIAIAGFVLSKLLYVRGRR